MHEMHFADNPFAPNDSSASNEFIHDDIVAEVNRVFNDRSKCVNTLPDGYSFHELSFETDGKDILAFINRHYSSTNSSTGLLYDDSMISFLRDTHEAVPYVIKYRDIIIALQVIEYVSIRKDDEVIPSAHADFLIVHPKFRKSFLANVFTAMVYSKVAERGRKVEFFSSHTELHFKSYATKNLCNLPISPLPKNLRLCRREQFVAKNLDKMVHIRLPTITEMNRLNDSRYKMQLVYSTDRLQSLLDHAICLTDGSNIAVFVPFFNTINSVPVKTVIMSDFIAKDDQSFRKFFRHVIAELRQQYCVDMITIINTNSDDIISFFNFEKNSVMHYYMMNMLPKIKRNEFMLTLR